MLIIIQNLNGPIFSSDYPQTHFIPSIIQYNYLVCICKKFFIEESSYSSSKWIFEYIPVPTNVSSINYEFLCSFPGYHLIFYNFSPNFLIMYTTYLSLKNSWIWYVKKSKISMLYPLLPRKIAKVENKFLRIFVIEKM